MKFFSPLTPSRITTSKIPISPEVSFLAIVWEPQPLLYTPACGHEFHGFPFHRHPTFTTPLVGCAFRIRSEIGGYRRESWTPPTSYFFWVTPYTNTTRSNLGPTQPSYFFKGELIHWIGKAKNKWLIVGWLPKQYTWNMFRHFKFVFIHIWVYLICYV